MSLPASPTVAGLPADQLMAAALNPSPVSSPAFAWVPPSVEEAARWFPDYELQALAGRGAMGAVYRAVNRKLDRPVAIKLLPAELAARDGVEARFQREARALARLNHPGIVALHDFGRTDSGHLFIVMEFVDGTDLGRLMHAEGGGLGVAQALEIVGQVCDALQYAHSCGFVHRDIKPGNVLVDRNGRVKIADFGLAKVMEERGAAGSAEPSAALTLTGQALGTPDYTAPEQLKGGAVDHRADIYSLGVMFYEMLTGELPRGAWPPPSTCTAAPVRLDEVVTRAMQTEPDKRYQQASEVKAAATAAETPAPQPPATYSSVNRVMVWLMFAFIVASAIITPTGDALTMVMLAAPFIVLAAWFKLKRRPAGLVSVLLAGMTMGAALLVGVLHFDQLGDWGKRWRGDGSRIDDKHADRVDLEALRAAAKQRGHERSTGTAMTLDRLFPAMQSYRNAVGDDAAASAWAAAKSDEAKYELIRGYIQYSTPTLAELPPKGLRIALTSLIPPGIKVTSSGDMAKLDAFVMPDTVELDGQTLTDSQLAAQPHREAAGELTVTIHALPGVTDQRLKFVEDNLRKAGLNFAGEPVVKVSGTEVTAPVSEQPTGTPDANTARRTAIERKIAGQRASVEAAKARMLEVMQQYGIVDFGSPRDWPNSAPQNPPAAPPAPADRQQQFTAMTEYREAKHLYEIGLETLRSLENTQRELAAESDAGPPSEPARTDTPVTPDR